MRTGRPRLGPPGVRPFDGAGPRGLAVPDARGPAAEHRPRPHRRPGRAHRRRAAPPAGAHDAGRPLVLAGLRDHEPLRAVARLAPDRTVRPQQGRPLQHRPARRLPRLPRGCRVPDGGGLAQGGGLPDGALREVPERLPGQFAARVHSRGMGRLAGPAHVLRGRPLLQLPDERERPDRGLRPSAGGLRRRRAGPEVGGLHPEGRGGADEALLPVRGDASPAHSGQLRGSSRRTAVGRRSAPRPFVQRRRRLRQGSLDPEHGPPHRQGHQEARLLPAGPRAQPARGGGARSTRSCAR